jgi:hypothetical protein
VPQWAHGDGGPTEHLVNGLCGYYYDGDARRILRHDSADPEFRHCNEVLWNIADLKEGPEATETFEWSAIWV